jgi:hypothetical protein
MVMMRWQDDGTLGPDSNSSVLPAKPGSTAALARAANSGGIGAALAQQKLQKRQRDLAAGESPAKELPGKGANRGTTGVLGSGEGIGTAGGGEAGLVGSVNPEVQNDDVLLPYQKI